MSAPRHALVLGATGFLGRWLIVELVSQGVAVTAAVRSVDSARTLKAWLDRHTVTAGVVSAVVDFDSEDLGLPSGTSALEGVTEIYNLAGAFRFGMTADEARRANVISAQRIVGLASRLPDSPRLVHVSGYRVGGQDPTTERSRDRTDDYARLGAYEASKIEADAVVQETAARLGVPFTIVNPATVIGVSTTGEADNQAGLAASVRDLWRGKLAALPGNARVFVPVVTVDYLARFMALVPTLPEAADQSYWVLDDETPGLPDLLTAVGRHYEVAVPRLRIPVGMIKRLPSAVTKADPETLSFMSTERYPTASAQELARRHGLQVPATLPAIQRWADHIAAHRFGESPAGDAARGFTSYAGIRTFGIGDPAAHTVVLPAVPVNADTWVGVAAELPEATRVLDLPGLGMSSGDPGVWSRWMADVAGGREGLHLVGHSIGAAVAVEFASTHPGQVQRLTLIAPGFLQRPAGGLQRLALLTAAYLRFAPPDNLSRTLLGSDAFASTLETSVVDLRRPGVARRIGRLLAAAGRRSTRHDLRQKLAGFQGDVHLVVGELDPLDSTALSELVARNDRIRVSTIAGAGHYPQISHPADLAATIGGLVSVGEVVER